MFLCVRFLHGTSYVIHDKQRTADGEQMAHAHVITPGTVRVDEAGELGRIDHVAKKPHIRDLHRTAGQTFEEELGRLVAEWEEMGAR